MSFEGLHFKYEWRDYQAEVLEKAQHYLDDGHIHVVAPPGSGKTILGLELMRRIDKPTIILAPTITIRNQWASRLIEFYTPDKKQPDWLSTDVNNPKFLTISTYQGLFAILKNKEEESLESELAEETTKEETEDDVLVLPEEYQDEVIEVKTDVKQEISDRGLEFFAKLKKLGIKTIVVDEAHHLRNEWWKCLMVLREEINKPVVVSLTATPPYDVLPSEWNRYEQFCGTIDVEVPIPSLIVNKAICPHQDYVYLSELSKQEMAKFEKVKTKIDSLLTEVSKDEELISSLLSHPALLDPKTNEEIIFESAHYFASCCAFLDQADQSAHTLNIKKMLTGKSKENIPFNLENAEVFFTGVLFADPYFQQPSLQVLRERLHDLFHKTGVLEKRRVILKDQKALAKALSQSQSKIEAVQEILNHEMNNLRDTIRCVVLTDYIRKSYIPTSNEKPTFDRIGVIPIFENLLANSTPEVLNKLCVLTGTIVVLPNELCSALETELREHAGLSGDNLKNVLTQRKYADSEDFQIIDVSDTNRQHIVSAITQLFERGEIRVIVGTRSLLGEGWDAPSINTLILATSVGSFMMSNQMRGRAIRVNPRDPNKVANIWHVAAVAPLKETLVPNVQTTYSFGYEYESLEKRFLTFVGVCAGRLGIESGVERISVLPELPTKKDISSLTFVESNRTHLQRSHDRESVRKLWEDSIAAGATGKMLSTIQSPSENIAPFPRSFVFLKSFWLIASAIFGAWLYVLASILEALPRGVSGKTILAIFAAASSYFIYRLLKLGFLWLRNPTPEKNMEKIAYALLEALFKSGVIETNPRFCEVTVGKDEFPLGVFCGVRGLSVGESNTFLNSLDQVFSPIDNPRYVMAIGKRKLIMPLRGAIWMAVPRQLDKKSQAQFFRDAMNKHVAKTRVFYTRNESGRKMLLLARKYSVLNKLQKRSERKAVWE